MARVCSRIANSSRFQNFIFGVIVANAITLGLGTYDWGRTVDDSITVADEVFLGIFVVELAIRIAAYGRRPQDFFKSGWNVFDFVVIGAAFLPGVRENVDPAAPRAPAARGPPGQRDARPADPRSGDGTVAAADREPRPAHAAAHVRLRDGGLDPVRSEDPEQWGNIGQAILSLFQILTLENWPDFLEAGQAIHPRRGSSSSPMY